MIPAVRERKRISRQVPIWSHAAYQNCGLRFKTKAANRSILTSHTKMNVLYGTLKKMSLRHLLLKNQLYDVCFISLFIKVTLNKHCLVQYNVCKSILDKIDKIIFFSKTCMFTFFVAQYKYCCRISGLQHVDNRTSANRILFRQIRPSSQFLNRISITLKDKTCCQHI